MGTNFVTDDDSVLDELRRAVLEHRTAGHVHVEFRRPDPPAASSHAVANEFVTGLAMQPPGAWIELDTQEALEVAIRVLSVDLAYKMPVMAIDLAQRLAHRFLACFDTGAVFLTNGSLARAGSRAWSPLTNATFDTGIVAVSSRRGGLLWVVDED